MPIVLLLSFTRRASPFKLVRYVNILLNTNVYYVIMDHSDDHCHNPVPQQKLQNFICTLEDCLQSILIFWK